MPPAGLFQKQITVSDNWNVKKECRTNNNRGKLEIKDSLSGENLENTGLKEQP